MVRLKILGFTGLIVALTSGVFASMEGSYDRDTKHGYVQRDTIRDDVLKNEVSRKNENFNTSIPDVDDGDEIVNVVKRKGSERASSD